MHGENEQGLRTIIDFVRKGSVVILVVHFFIFCFAAFEQWGLTNNILKRVLLNVGNISLFKNLYFSKLASLGLLLLSLLGAKGKKEEKLKVSTIVLYLLCGLAFYFGSVVFFYTSFPVEQIAVAYIAITSIGFFLILSGGARLSRLIKLKFKDDIFNEQNETFPQEERLLQNEYSINLPGEYKLKGKSRRMWINIVNPFRSTLCVGSPGAGKSYFFIRHVITQHIRKGFTMFLYDFKFPDLTKIAYNTWLKNKGAYAVPPRFYYINFDDLNKTHRCNPLEPETMLDITDAAEASRTILLGLNRDWIKKSGGDRAIFN